MLGRFKSLFARGEKPAAQPSPKPAATFSSPVEDDEVLLGLQDFLSEEKGDFDRSLHLVSLVEFREAVGDKWTRLSPKVVLIAEGVIARHVGDAGTFSRYGEDGFVIVFRGLTQEQERARAIAAASDLGQRLLGAQFAAAETPLALAAEVPIKDALRPDGKLDAEIIAQAVSRARSLITPEDRQASLYDLQSDEERALRRHMQPSDWVAPEAAAARRRAGGPAPVSLPTDFAPFEAARVGRVGLLYRPCWVAEQRAVAATLCLGQRQAEADGPILIGSAAYDPAEPGLGLTLDRSLAQAAALLLGGALDSPLLILPLALNSLIAIRRMHMTGPLGEVPEKLRQRRLMIEVTGIPDGITPGQLGDGVAAARMLGGEVMLRTNLTRPLTGAARDAGASQVGIDLAELEPPEKAADPQLAASLFAFRDQARAAQLSTYVWGVRRRPLLAELVHGGIDLLNGPALMKDLAKPCPAIPAPHSRFTSG